MISYHKVLMTEFYTKQMLCECVIGSYCTINQCAILQCAIGLLYSQILNCTDGSCLEGMFHQDK